MSVESGKNGNVMYGASSVLNVSKWEFKKQAAVDQYGTSSTAGFKAATAGTKSGDGTIEGKLDLSSASPIGEGTSVSLSLYIDSTHFWAVPAVIKEFSTSADMNEGTVVPFSASFVTNGAWTEPTFP